MNRLEGKVTLVMGGTGGFGRATVQRFAQEGAAVVVASRRGEVAADVAASVGGVGVACDVSDFDQLNDMTDQILSTHGSIDVAVNFSGVAQPAMISEITPESLHPIVDVNISGAIYFLRAMGNAMAAGGGGSIISAGSILAHRPSVGNAMYGASKRALEYFTEIAALEYGAVNVRVNAIAAHMIETEMTQAIFENKLMLEAARNQTPLGRMGTLIDVANCALFLASDESQYISGETIRIDGGAATQKIPSPTDLTLLAKARPDLLGS